MDLQILLKPLSTQRGEQSAKLGGHKSEARVSVHRETGEITLTLVLVLLIASGLFAALLWLNVHFEKKTKEHLRDFQNDWKTLEARYKT